MTDDAVALLSDARPQQTDPSKYQSICEIEIPGAGPVPLLSAEPPSVPEPACY